MANFSCSSGAGDAGGGNNHGAYGYGSVSESGTNTAGNYSTVKWSLSASYYCNSGWTWGGTTRSSAGYLDMVINDKVVGTLTLAIGRGWGNGTSIGSTSGQLNIGHANDGKGSCKAYIRIRSGNDPLGGGVVYYGGSSSTQTINLTTIPRASTPSLSGTAVAGKAVTVNTNRASNNFTHNLTYKFGSVTGKIGDKVTTSVSWTPSIDLMAQIPNSKTGTGTITCDTYNGNTKIGTETINFTLNQPADAGPTMESKWEETGLMSDGVTTLASKGVDAATVIGQLSVKTITITCETKYSSTVKSISCTHNGTTQTSSSSPATFSFEAPVDTGEGKSYFQWTVTDSRGNTVTDSISMTFTPYAKPIVASIVATRTSSVSDTGTITITGTFFNGNVGDIANDVTVTYRYLDTDHSLPTLFKDGQNWSGADGISGVSPDAAYTFTATVTDSFGYSSSKSITLDKAVATLWVGKETVRVNDHLFVGGKSLLDLTYPVGSIYMSVNSTSPEVLFGGTWERLKSRFLLPGEDDGEYKPGTEGGSATHTHTTSSHTLTENEMPSHTHSYTFKDVWVISPQGGGSDQQFGVPYRNSKSSTTGATGGGKGHSHGDTGAASSLPPYLVVYAWKRTA